MKLPIQQNNSSIFFFFFFFLLYSKPVMDRLQPTSYMQLSVLSESPKILIF